MATEQTTLEQLEEELAAVRGAQNVRAEAHAQDEVTDPPDSPAAGHIMYAQGGHMKYVSADGTDYNTGQNINVCSGALTLTASLQTVSGVQFNLGTGTYAFDGQLLIRPTAGGGTMNYQATSVGGLVVSNGRLSWVEVVANAVVPGVGFIGADTLFTSTNALGTADRVTYFKGIMVIGTAGTLSVQAKMTGGGTASILQYGTYGTAYPITP